MKKLKISLICTFAALLCCALLAFVGVHLYNAAQNAISANTATEEISAPEPDVASGGLLTEQYGEEIVAPEINATATATTIERPALKSVTGGGDTIYSSSTQIVVYWTGNRVQAEFSINYNPSYMTISGTGIANTSTPCAYGTDAGQYTVVFTPKSGYTWSNGTTTGHTCYLVIQKKVSKPTFSGGSDDGVTGSGQSATAVYTGKYLSATFNNNYDASAMKASGGTTTYAPIAAGTNAGEYTVTFKLESWYLWSDGTTKDVTCTLTITKATVTIPTLTASGGSPKISGRTATAVCTGSEIAVALSGYDSSTMSLSATGTTIKGTIAGTYSKTVSLKDTANYQWSDKTITGKTFSLTLSGKAVSSLTITAPSDQTYTGQALTPKPTVKDGTTTLTENTHYTLKYEDNTNAGTAKVTITGKGDSYGGSVEKTFTIKTKAVAVPTLSKGTNADSTASVSNQSATTTYNTKAQYFTISSVDNITFKNVTGGATRSDKNFYATNAGTYTVTMSLDSNHCWGSTDGGTDVADKTLTLTINKLNFTNNTAITSSQISDYDYDGNAKTPTPTISYNTYALTKDTHFTFSYNRHVNASTSTAKAEVIITATGTNCEGTKKFSFTINKGSITPTLSYGTVTYGTKSGTPTVGGNSGSGTVTYSVSTTGCTGGATVNTDGIITPTKAGTVKVKVTIAATDNYNGGEKEITVTIGARDLANATIDDLTKTYTGGAISPALTVRDAINGGTAVLLTKDADYTVVFTDNINVGSKATATLTGKGNYTGTKTFCFTIEQRSITNATTDPGTIPSCTYDGSPQTPTPTVKDGTRVLVEGTDFEYGYENNIEVGAATLIIKGLGNYNGEKKITFSIDPPSVADATVILSQTTYTYDGTAKEPRVTSVSVAGLTLKEGVDFTVGYSANIKAGTAKVVLTGIGAYAGTKEVEFTISPADLSTAVITGLQLQYVFTGSDIEPNITVTLDGVELVKNTDYLVTYIDNLNFGTAQLTVTGSKNYTGTLTDTFAIIRASISSATVTGVNATYEYTTAAIEPLPVVNWNGILLVKDTDYTVSYSPNVDLGTITVTIAGLGNFNNTVTTTFEIVQANITNATVTGVNANYTYTGSDIEPAVAVELKGVTLTLTTDYTVTYTDNVDKGTATITITGVGNYTGTATVNFVIDEAGVDDATVTGINATYEYTGSAITPEPVVTWNSITLVKDTDYTVAYSANVDLDTVTVTITGLGNFNKTLTTTFEIVQANITTATVTGVNSNYTYTGSDIEPAVTVELKSVTLTLTTDYTVTYADNVDKGTATITITGTGNYTGTVTVNFVIDEAGVDDATITGIDATYEYTTAAITPLPVVTWKGITLVKDTDYTVLYTANVDLGTVTITVTGIGNFNKTLTTTFEIVQADITNATVTGVNSNYTYTGSDIEPTVAVELKGVTLLTTDYTVTYTDNVDKGTATITVTGVGNYTGTVTVNFVIDEADMDDATVTGINTTYEYTGSAITPEPAVTFNGVTLVKDVDYTVSYSANVDLGTVTVTITGLGNFTAVKEVTFEIVQADITNAPPLTGVNEEYGYTGSAITPEPVITMNDTALVKDTDYTVSYANNTDLGIAVVTLQGIGSYTGRKSIAFNIVQADISNATVTGVDASYEWTGSAIEPTFTVTLNGVTLVKDTDYTLVITDNTEVGTASYLITGTGNYKGSKDGTFEVVKAKLLVDVVYIDYNGTATLFVGNELPKIIAVATRKDDGTTTVSGSVAWDNEIDGSVIALKLGKYKYGWTFTPVDTDHYEVTTGDKELTAESPTYAAIHAEWKNGSQPTLFTSTSINVIKQNLIITGIFNDGKTAEILGGYSVKGSWDTTAAANTANMPKNGGNDYSITVVFGDLESHDLFAIVIQDVALSGLVFDAVDGGEVTTEYTALDAFDTSSVVVTAQYNDGSEKPLEAGKNGYKVVYGNGADSLQYGDTKVTLSYTEKGVTKTVDVEGLEVAKKPFDAAALTFAPEDRDYDFGNPVTGDIAVENMPKWLKVTYVYTDAKGNEIAAAEVKNAGKYSVTAKFTVDDNHEEIDDITVTFVIKQIEPTLTPAVGGSFSEGTALKDLTISANNGTTAGTLTWDDTAYALKAGINRCYFTFTPDDTVNFKVVHGYVDITTELPQPAPAENGGVSLVGWQVAVIIIICIVVAIIAVTALVMALKLRRVATDADGFYDDVSDADLAKY